MKISFTSIVPKGSGDHSLSFIVLKSYLLWKNIDWDIILNSFFCEDSEEQMISKILAQDINIIAFSAYIWNIEIIKRISQKIKQKKKDVFFIVGGAEVSNNSKKVLEQSPWLDLLVQGEGEEVLYDILKIMARGNRDFRDIPGVTCQQGGQIIANPPSYQFRVENQNYKLCLDDLIDSEYILYETSRGCVFKCRYCAWKDSPKREVRCYSMDKVKKDLKALFGLPKIKCIAFTDSNILFNMRRGLEIFRFLNELNKERCKKNLGTISFHFETTPEFFNDEIIDEALKFSNDNKGEHTFGFGIQSIDGNVLRISDRKSNLKKFTENYIRLKQRGLKNARVEVIYGLPGDTLESYKKTIEYMISILNVEYFQSYHYYVLPGSYFAEHAKDYGLVWENTPPYKLLYSNTFSEDDFRKADRLAYYLHIIYYSLRRIKKMIDMKFKDNKLHAYEKVIDSIYQNFGDHLTPKGNLGDIILDVRNLQKPENFQIRQSIIQDAKNIIIKE